MSWSKGSWALVVMAVVAAEWRAKATEDDRFDSTHDRVMAKIHVTGLDSMRHYQGWMVARMSADQTRIEKVKYCINSPQDVSWYYANPSADQFHCYPARVVSVPGFNDDGITVVKAAVYLHGRGFDAIKGGIVDIDFKPSLTAGKRRIRAELEHLGHGEFSATMIDQTTKQEFDTVRIEMASSWGVPYMLRTRVELDGRQVLVRSPDQFPKAN